MNKVFTKNGWEDYIYWQTQDKKTLKRINTLIEDISRNGNEGIGKPEPLKGNLSGYWRHEAAGAGCAGGNGAGLQAVPEGLAAGQGDY